MEDLRAMSSVTGTDGGYRYYQKSVSDLEDDLKDEAKKARQRQEDEADRLERAHHEELRTRDEKNAKTVENVRNNSGKLIAQERRKAEEEVKNAKAQNYDRLGRVYGEETNGVREQLKAAQSQMQQIQEREGENRMRAENVYQDRLAEQHEKTSEEAERAINSAKEETRQAYEDLQTERRQSDESTVGHAKGRYEELTKSAIDERNEARRQYDRAFKEASLDFQSRIAKKDASTDKMAANLAHEQMVKTDRAVDNQRRLHAEETRVLRDQVKDMAVADSKRGDGNGPAAQRLKEIEGEYRTRELLQEERHVGETAKLKAEVGDTENYQSRRQQEVIQDKDRQFTDALRKQNRETSQQVSDFQSTYDRDRKQTELRNEKAIAGLSARQQKVIEGLDEKNVKVLQEQDKNFLETQREHSLSEKNKIDALQNELKRSRGYEDPTKISPQAEEAIRRSVGGQYEKMLGESQELGERKAASVRDDYQTRLRQQKLKSDSVEHKLLNGSRLEIDADRARFGQYLQDAEFQKGETLKNKEMSHERETQKLLKSSAVTMEEQRRQFEDVVESMHYDNAQRMNAVRSDLEFQLKQARRDYAANYNELARAGEKKLTEQREQYDILLANEKFDGQKLLREQDKRFKTLSDEQTRGYEQRIKQMEQQQKEKERTIAENYEIEIDKLRHTNAALVQKKS